MPEVAPSEGTSTTRERVKRLEVGCRVSGSFGEYRPNPNPNIKRRVRERIFGHIICAVDRKKYKVRWDDGRETEVFSNCLSKESLSAALPPDLPPSRQQDNPELPPQGQAQADEEEEEIQEAQHDQEESEHLPGGVGEASGSSESEDESIASGVSSDDIDQVEEERGEEGGNAAGSSRKKNNNNNDDPNGRMPGQLSSEAPPLDYHGKRNAAIAHIKTLIGKSFSVKHKNKPMTWTVVDEWIPSDPTTENKPLLGLCNFDATEYTREQALAYLFLHLMFADWRVTFGKINSEIMKVNRKQGKKVRPFTEEEFLTALGLLIAAAEYGQRGASLWKEGDQKDSHEKEEWESMVPHPSFEKFMKLYRFKEFRHFLPLAYASEALREANDPWWQFREAVTEFNNNRKEKIHFPQWVAIDESMSAWKPRTTKNGNLPNISFIARKPEPLGENPGLLLYSFLVLLLTFLLLIFAAAIGTEFKSVACPITGTMLHLEIQEGREGMKAKRLNKELGTTAGCTVRLMEACSKSTGIKRGCMVWLNNSSFRAGITWL
jgi:hypothetical protein